MSVLPAIEARGVSLPIQACRVSVPLKASSISASINACDVSSPVEAFRLGSARLVYYFYINLACAFCYVSDALVG